MPTIVNGFEVFGPGELPEARPQRPRRGARRKYPWWETERGAGFRFGQDVIEQSARVQASNMSHSTGYEFKVYTGKDGFLWCVRVDGLPRSAWPDIPKQSRIEEPSVPAGDLPQATAEIDSAFANTFHDDGGGVPQTFGVERGFETAPADEEDPI